MVAATNKVAFSIADPIHAGEVTTAADVPCFARAIHRCVTGARGPDFFGQDAVVRSTPSERNAGDQRNKAILSGARAGGLGANQNNF